MYQQKKWLYLSLLIIAALVLIVGVPVFRRGGASMQARTAVIISDVNSSDDSAVPAAVEQLIADFTDEPNLPQALWQIGQQYYNNAVRYDRADFEEQAADYYRKAIALRERIIQEWPHSDLLPKAHFTAAIIYSQELHEYEKGIQYFQKVVDNWPDYKYAYHAQYLIGSYYERLKKPKGVAQADAKIEAAYKAVIEKYPDSPSTPHAARKLGNLYLNKERWADAAYYLQMFVQTDKGRAPKHLFLSVLLDLVRLYEEMGELDMAAETYHTFLQSAQPDHPRAKAIRTKLEKLQGAKK